MILPGNGASWRVAEKLDQTRDGNVVHAGFGHLPFRLAPDAAAPAQRPES